MGHLKLGVLFLTILGVLSSCKNSASTEQSSNPKEGIWRGVINLNDSTELPFNFEMRIENDVYEVIFHNADERLPASSVTEVGDSLRIQMPVFATYLMFEKGSESMRGVFVNPDATNYRLPLRAEYGDSSRFDISEDQCCNINRKWRVALSPGTDEEDPAIAYFDQEGSYIKATFLTEYGDWRYLEGVLDGDLLRLSAFNGGSLYYLEGKVEGQRIQGLRYSGRSFMEPWTAWRDETYELPDQDTLTYLKEGYESISFSFPNLKGDTLSDTDLAGKPVIITIMGSWCPNCMDEARHLTDLYEAYHEQGLEIVGLTFERVRNREEAVQRAQKMVDDLGIPYPVLLAGATREDRAGDALPMLNHIMSFPTSIYLNAEHEVVRIHTGFNGPGTPLYEDFVARNTSFVETELLKTPKS